MATSSITHNFVISDSESIQRLLDALEAANMDRTPMNSITVRELTDPNEIIAFMQKREQLYA